MQGEFQQLIYHNEWLQHEEELRELRKEPKAETRRQIRQEIKEDRIRFVNML